MTPTLSSRSKTRSLRDYASENGVFLLLHRILGAALRRTRDAIIARKLHTSGLKIGRLPRLGGLAHMSVGRNLSAGENFWLEAITSRAGEAFSPKIIIGDNCSFSDQVHIACTNRVTVGPGVLCGSRVIITDHSHGRMRTSADGSPASDPFALPPNERPLSRDGEVEIGRNVWIGDGCVILPGSRIGDGCILAANSVLKGDVPAGSIAAGAPACVVSRWDAAEGAWLRVRD